MIKNLKLIETIQMDDHILLSSVEETIFISPQVIYGIKEKSINEKNLHKL